MTNFAASSISFGAASEERHKEHETYVSRRGGRRGIQVTPLYRVWFAWHHMHAWQGLQCPCASKQLQSLIFIFTTVWCKHDFFSHTDFEQYHSLLANSQQRAETQTRHYTGNATFMSSAGEQHWLSFWQCCHLSTLTLKPALCAEGKWTDD